MSVSGDYGIVNQIEFQGRSFAGASVSNYGVVQTGDVVYTKSPLNSNPYGIIKTNKGKPGIVSTLYAVYHPKENAFSDFIQVYFEQHARMNNYMHPLVNKGAKNDMKVSAENALKGPVCFPSRIEQESISAFFSVLDNLITLHQRQPFLHSPPDISLIVQLTPPFYTFSWEQRKWINTVDISTNMVDPKSGKYDLLPHVAPGNIESFTGRLYDNVKLVGEENLISGKFVFNVGDIVYGKINPQLGKYVFARFSGLTSADAYVLNAKNGIVQKFLYAVIQTRDFYDYSVSVSKRSGMPKINRDELNAYSYWAPSESEQLKIGEYLLTLDHLITLHQRELEKLQNIKKSMLEKMFV